MRLTTLLDTLTEAGSGPWPPVASPSTPTRATDAGATTDARTTTDARGTTEAPSAGDARTTGEAPGTTDVGLLALGTETEFEQLVSTLIPCRANDAELWFAERTEEVELAKSLCRGCPVRAGCLAGAIERQEPWGVWGGEVFVDGAVVARKRGRGRPRKGESL